jgi:hypothetical protein
MSNIEECLRVHGISIEDYSDIILALFQAAPKDPAAHVSEEFDSKFSPTSNATVSRDFGSLRIDAEDRGPVYAVWIMRIQKDGGLGEVLEFGEFQWGALPV